jgi:hypothetical protein
MRTWTPLYEGDGLFHYPRKAAPADKSAETRAAEVARKELAEKRGEAMRGFFPKLASWLAGKSYAAQMAEIDRYLSQAADIYDLEDRIRRLERERGFPHPYY